VSKDTAQAPEDEDCQRQEYDGINIHVVCVSDASRKLTEVGFAKDADWLARLYELLSLSVLTALFVASQTLNVLVAYD
jgi:hypothetical protein